MGRGKQRADHRADLRGKPFVGLPAAVLYSAAYQALSPTPRCILMELLGRFNGYNNGKIGMSYREMADRLGTKSLKSIGPAIIDLHSHGFLDVTAEGKWKQREARLYRLTFISSGSNGQIPATNDYARWTPQEAKSSLPKTVTEKPHAVPQTVTEPSFAVPHTVSEKPTSSVWGKAEPVTVLGTLIGKPSLGGNSEGQTTPSAADDPNRAPSCERCGEPFTSAGRGQPKRFCSERCRKAAEAQRRHDRQKAAA
jgi:hypothetical protein